MTYSMVKKQSEKTPKKACFGTKEWSQNSGICRRCEHKEECGKIENNRKG
jgi:hypothetical protein